MKKSHILIAAIAALATSAVQAQTIVSLNFHEDAGTPAGTLGATDSAGVLNVDNWNNVNGELDNITFPPSIALNDSDGNPSGISLSETDGKWFDQNNSAGGTGADQTMMDWGAKASGGDATDPSFTLSGFGTDTYDVYLYVAFTGGATSVDYTVTANTGSIAFDPDDEITDYTGTFTELTTSQNGNYIFFEGLSGDDLTVSVNSGTSDFNAVGINGVQVSVIPEPSSLALVAGGFAGLLLFRRRRSS